MIPAAAGLVVVAILVEGVAGRIAALANARRLWRCRREDLALAVAGAKTRRDARYAELDRLTALELPGGQGLFPDLALPTGLQRRRVVFSSAPPARHRMDDSGSARVASETARVPRSPPHHRSDLMTSDTLAGEPPAIQALATLAAAGWQLSKGSTPDVHIYLRNYSGGWPDVLTVLGEDDARAHRVNPDGYPVWRREGGVADVIDQVRELPLPGRPGAPTLVLPGRRPWM